MGDRESKRWSDRSGSHSGALVAGNGSGGPKALESEGERKREGEIEQEEKEGRAARDGRLLTTRTRRLGMDGRRRREEGSRELVAVTLAAPCRTMGDGREGGQSKVSWSVNALTESEPVAASNLNVGFAATAPSRRRARSGGGVEQRERPGAAGWWLTWTSLVRSATNKGRSVAARPGCLSEQMGFHQQQQQQQPGRARHIEPETKTPLKEARAPPSPRLGGRAGCRDARTRHSMDGGSEALRGDAARDMYEGTWARRHAGRAKTGEVWEKSGVNIYAIFFTALPRYAAWRSSAAWNDSALARPERRALATMLRFRLRPLRDQPASSDEHF